MSSALFEYFDNSTSSFFEKGSKKDERFIITLVDRREKNNYKLSVIDNAFGMNEEDFIRAIRIDNKQKMSERNKFGVGLKVSAIWFSDIWSITTKQRRISRARNFTFNLPEIQNSSSNEFPANIYEESFIGSQYGLDFESGTIIELINPVDLPVNKNSVSSLVNNISTQFSNDIKNENVKFIVAEIKENRNGSIEFFDLVGKYFGDDNYKVIKQSLTRCMPVKAEEVKWHKINGYEEYVDINFDVIDPRANNQSEKLYTITGRVGWIEKSGVGKGGFKRLWKGRALESRLWKPEEILGKPNGYIAQRMYGELDLSQFEPTNSKDGFIINSELENEIIEKLKSELSSLKSKINKVSKEMAFQKKTNNEKNIQNSFDKSASYVFKTNDVINNKVIISNIEESKRKEALYEISGKNVSLNVKLSSDIKGDELIVLTNYDDDKFIYYFSINEKHDLISYASEDNLDNITRMIFLVCYSEVVARIKYYVEDHFESLSHIKYINMNFYKKEENGNK